MHTFILSQPVATIRTRSIGRGQPPEFGAYAQKRNEIKTYICQRVYKHKADQETKTINAIDREDILKKTPQ